MTVLRDLRTALVDAVLVVGDGLRLLWRHWPALLTLFLFGLAVRNGVMWGAVLLGRDHPVLASLLVPLAPLAMVVALVLMLQQTSASMRWPVVASTGGRGSRLALLTSALVPFLTVYAVQGHLEDDSFQFINESYADEFARGQIFTTGSLDDRTIVTVTSWQVGLIVVTLLARTVLDKLDVGARGAAGATAVAAVEVTWLTWLATLLTARLGDVRDWVGERVLVSGLLDAWDRFSGWFGPLTDPLRALGDLLAGIVDRIGEIVVTPVAWLAVGAVVLAGGLAESRRARLEQHRVVVRMRERGRAVGERVSASRLGRLRPRTRPGAVTDLLGRRFEELINGLRVVAHGGLLSVLTFCLVLALPQLAEWGAAMGLRSVVGPGDPGLMIALSPYLDAVTRTVYTVLVVVLVAAAVDRLLGRRLAEDRAAQASSSTSIST